MGVRVGDGEDRVRLKTEEVGFVAFLEVTTPGGSEVRRVVGSVGEDEGDAAVPKVVGAVGCVGIEVGGADGGLGRGVGV